MGSEELAELLERALAEVKLDHVTLTGGEPFARPDFFLILDICRDAGVPVQIISNGGLVNDVLAKRLSAYEIRCVQITLNGPTAALHEEHVGGGHWDATIFGINALRKRDVEVAGCIVITRRNADRLGETLDLFQSLGVNAVALSRFSPAGYSASQVALLLPSRSDIVKALEQAERRGNRGMDLQMTMPVPPCVVEHEKFPHIAFGSCPIGTEMQEFALGPRGELRSCTLHTRVLGDATSTSFAKLVGDESLREYRDVVPEFCAPCPEKQRCIGGCGAAADAVLGDARKLDPFVAQHVDDAFGFQLKQIRKQPRLPVYS